jgi:toxin ParE1/3/4
MLSVLPMSGQARPEFGARLRSIPVRWYSKYLIFYQLLSDGIEVIRIVHGARNLQRLF